MISLDCMVRKQFILDIKAKGTLLPGPCPEFWHPFPSTQGAIFAPLSEGERCVPILTPKHMLPSGPLGPMALHTSHSAPHPKLLQFKPSLCPASHSHITLPIWSLRLSLSCLPSLSGISWTSLLVFISPSLSLLMAKSCLQFMFNLLLSLCAPDSSRCFWLFFPSSL